MAERGKEGPNRILDSRPAIFFWLMPVWEGYQHLTSCRPQGFTGVGQIPWTAMNEYALRHGITGWKFDRFVHFVEVLDGIYLASRPQGGTGRPRTIRGK